MADVCIALDFGHGLFGAIEREIVSAAKFSALTVQSNAGNYEFNRAKSYSRAAYVCVDEPEARLALGRQNDWPKGLWWTSCSASTPRRPR